MQTLDEKEQNALILKYIQDHAQEAVEFYRRVVQIPSIWGNAEQLDKLARFIGDTLLEVGLKIDYVDSGSPGMPAVLARLKGSGKGKSLILTGHMDVYPPSGFWGDPFSGRLADGKVFGQGTADMKGGLSAAVIAARFLAASGIPCPGDLIVFTIPNHFEGGISTRLALKNGLRSDCAVICEPSDLKIITSQRGLVYLKITVKGQSAHSTAKNKAVNPIIKMAHLLQRLESIQLDGSGSSHCCGGGSISTTIINGGIKHNLIPDTCTAVVDIRFPPGYTMETTCKAIQDCIETEKRLDPQLSVEVEAEETCVINPRNSTMIDNTSPLTQAVIESSKLARGKEPVIGCHPAWPETPLFNEAGIQALCFGPGSMDCYWEDESVAVEDYLDAIRVYCLTALKLWEDSPVKMAVPV